MRYTVILLLPMIGCATPAEPIEAEPAALTKTCNGFQPDQCASCADTLPFEDALPVTVSWCQADMCPKAQEPWFCKEGEPDIMCSVIGGTMPDGMAVHCCDPIAALYPCYQDADCGKTGHECYRTKCVESACTVQPKPVGTPCSLGACQVPEGGKPVVCLP